MSIRALRKNYLLLLFTTSVFSVAAQFSERVVYNSETRIISTGFDINLDGAPDILGASLLGISWYENLLNGEFSQEKIIPSLTLAPSSYFVDVTPGDIDMDGDIDIAFMSGDNFGGTPVLGWHENLGNGEFSVEQILSTAVNSFGEIEIGDINGDGMNDIVFCVNEYYDKISWIENLGSGSFAPEQVIGQGIIFNDIDGIELSDFDSDGDLDILGELLYLENLGGAVFAPAVTIAIGVNSRLILEDLDNDGDDDVVTNLTNLAWYENVNGGGFNQTIIASGTYYAVGASDLDNDGDIDIVGCSSIGAVAYFENIGGGTFSPGQILSFSLNTQVAFSDITGNGFLDIIIGNGQYINWIENNGSNIFGAEYTVDVNPFYVRNIMHVDIDNDNDEDVIGISSNMLFWYENINEWEHSKAIVIEIPGMTDGRGIAAGDINNDGLVDLIVAEDEMSNCIHWVENLGGGNFGTVTTSSAPGGLYSEVIVVDIDNDGDDDIVVRSTTSIKSYWFENLGGTSLASAQLLINTITTAYPPDLDIGDINNDGWMDFVGSEGSNILWMENLGNGQLGAAVNVTTNGENIQDVDVGDLNGDSLLDIVYCSQDGNKVVWHQNLGAGVFGSEVVLDYTQWTIYEAIELNDFDNDDDLDIIALSIGNAYYFENLGNGNFSPKILISSFPGDNYPMDCISFDHDNDGDKDILMNLGNQGFNRIKNFHTGKYQAEGYLFIDQNQNAVLDSTDIGINFGLVSSIPQSVSGQTDSFGWYKLVFEDTAGVYQVAPEISPLWDITTDSISYTVVLDSNYIMLDSLIFGIYPNTIVDSVSIELVGGFPTCNDTVNYWINIQNYGTTTPSGAITLVLDSALTYFNSSSLPDSIVGDTLYWSYDTLNYFSDIDITIQVIMPDFNGMGDTLSSSMVLVVLDSMGMVSFQTTSSLDQILVCAYDPNDKLVSPEGETAEGFIHPNQEYLEYTIRFQNTGNGVANNVMIEDQIDESLDWSTYNVLASSHNVQSSINNLGHLTFNFQNINLTDSTTSFLGSQGYVKYRIELLQNLPVGTVINNQAQIFFDQNPPIVTNETINTLDLCYFEGPQVTFASFLTFDTLVCVDSGPFLLAESSPTGGNYFGTGINGSSFEPAIAGTGTHTIYYEYLDSINGCYNSDSANVQVLSVPLIALQPFANDTVCVYSDSIPLPSGSPGPGVFSGSGVINDHFYPSVANPGQNLVYYHYTDVFGCTGLDSTFIYVDGCLGISEFDDLKFSVAPNPFQGQATISMDENFADLHSFEIVNSLGEIVFPKMRMIFPEITITAGDIGTGVFIVRIIHESTNQIVGILKIVVL